MGENCILLLILFAFLWWLVKLNFFLCCETYVFLFLYVCICKLLILISILERVGHLIFLFLRALYLLQILNFVCHKYCKCFQTFYLALNLLVVEQRILNVYVVEYISLFLWDFCLCCHYGKYFSTQHHMDIFSEYLNGFTYILYNIIIYIICDILYINTFKIIFGIARDLISIFKLILQCIKIVYWIIYDFSLHIFESIQLVWLFYSFLQVFFLGFPGRKEYNLKRVIIFLLPSHRHFFAVVLKYLSLTWRQGLPNAPPYSCCSSLQSILYIADRSNHFSIQNYQSVPFLIHYFI